MPRRLNGGARKDFSPPVGVTILAGALPALSDEALEWLSLAAYVWGGMERGSRDECWPWRGFLDKNGYGQVFRSRKAHQIAFELVHGAIPDGQIVLHSCDNPPCCNPRHLSVGTWADNTAQMYARGRARPRGQAQRRGVVL